MATALRIGLTFTSSTIGWILCTMIIYFSYRFYKFRSYQPLQKRYPPLVYLITISMVFYIGLSQSLMHILWLDRSNDDGHQMMITDLSSNILSHFDKLFYSFSLHGATMAMISRGWMIYFNIKWGLETQKAKWTIHIDPGEITSFWFIKHKKDYGSLKYIKIFSFTYYISVGMFLFLLRTTTDTTEYELLWRSLDSLLYLIEIIILIIIWMKIPSLPESDTFGIKSELKYTLRYALCALIIYIIWIICMNTSNIPKWTNPIFSLIIYIFVTFIALTFNGYIFWSKYRYLILTDCDDVAIMLNIHQREQQQNEINVDSLSDTLQNEQLFEAFFEHLSNEFYPELLLSYIEFCDFKKLMQKDGIIMNIRNDDITNIVLELSVTPSYIIFESHKNISNDIARYILIAIDLFNKYINNLSDFQINISYGDTNKITSFINKYRNGDIDIDTLKLTEEEQQKLYSLYDNCIATMYKLMTFSHGRFTETTRYTSIKTII